VAGTPPSAFTRADARYWLDFLKPRLVEPLTAVIIPPVVTVSPLPRFPFVLAIPQKYTAEPQARRAGYLLCDVSKEQVARLMLRAT
jgi:hypothetical protein